jgi:hypothetical protein
MMTLSLPVPMPTGLLAALRQSWAAALAEAVIGALSALLLGPALIDPASGVSLAPR